METNETAGQVQPEPIPQPEQTLSVPVFTPQQPEQPELLLSSPPQPEQSPLYDPGVTTHVAELIRGVFDPAYILLFGTLAKGTPHSDALSYDLLIATNDPPQHNWLDVKRYLRMKMPSVGHGAPYLNIYMYPVNFVVSQSSPLFYLARKEGVLLYRGDRHKFNRPKRPYSFSQAACDAKHYYATFMSLGTGFLEQADRALTEHKIRPAAFSAAQAAVYFYQVLFRVYHGLDFDTCDVMILHERTRTLSAELLLLFESDSYNPIYTLPCLRRFIVKARYDPKFFIHAIELEQHLDRVKRMQGIVEKLCLQRIDLYNKLSTPDEPDEQ